MFLNMRSDVGGGGGGGGGGSGGGGVVLGYCEKVHLTKTKKTC